jgi:uncharacterized protein (TIGR02145 family)
MKKIKLMSTILFCAIFLHTKAQKTFIYPTVKINNIEWGIENIKITKFENGDPIPQAKTKKDWLDAAIAKTPIYEVEYINNKPEYRYNFYVFLDKRGVIPNGYSLPTEEDFDNLASYLSENQLLISRLKILQIGSQIVYREKSKVNFDPLLVSFWCKDETTNEMLTYDMGTSKCLFANNECPDKFPAYCDGSYGSLRFETLYETGASDAGNGFCVRLIKRK